MYSKIWVVRALFYDDTQMKKGRKKFNQAPRVRINEGIRARSVRVIDSEEGNLGVLDTRDAIEKAYEKGLDLIEISPDADPPVAKIMDYGKHMYDLKKKAKEVKANKKTSEVKNVQVKVGTSDHDKKMKGKRADKWLSEGHRIQVELFLRGRVKYLDKDFLNEKLREFLNYVSVPHKLVHDAKKSSAGMALLIERDKSKPLPEKLDKEEKTDNLDEDSPAVAESEVLQDEEK
jgi:translation initiation factor IF-3